MQTRLGNTCLLNDLVNTDGLDAATKIEIAGPSQSLKHEPFDIPEFRQLSDIRRADELVETEVAPKTRSGFATVGLHGHMTSGTVEAREGSPRPPLF